MPKPDFFIVGAAKCGTSSLRGYLMEHPEIFIPPAPPIEPHYFFQEAWRSPISLREYLSLFEKAGAFKRRGEKSVWYLYGETVPQRIFDFAPQADIIVALRNPIDMLYSLHSQFLYGRNEDIEDFAEALDAEEDRKQGRRIPPGCRWKPMLFYREVARYSVQLERYFKVFGREKVLVLIFDDMVGNTPETYARVLRFLGVDNTFRPDFSVHNPNKVARSKRLMYLRQNYPEWARRLGAALLPAKKARNALMGTFTRLLTKETKRPPMPTETRRKLESEFRPEVERLSELLGRDLTHWVESSAPEEG